MKFKALVIALLVPAFFLIGCGQLETNEGTAGTALENLTNNGAITEEEASSIDESMLDENVQVSETGSNNSIMMKVGGADLLIDFLDNLTGAGDEIAMVINGVQVPSAIAADAQSMQGLVASLVTSQLEGIDILGIPVGDLVQAGLGLISGDTSQANFSGLFGTLIRGALNMFMGGSPIGMIVGALAGPLIDNVLDNVFDNDSGDSQGSNAGSNNQGQNNQGQNNNNNNNNNNDNSGGGLLGGIIDTIGGIFGGGGSNNSSPLGGIFNLITNLFN